MPDRRLAAAWYHRVLGGRHVDETGPGIGPVLETALYVSDLDRSAAFYQRVLGFPLASEPALTFRYVGVFVMRGGRWQCVASQSTKVTT